MHTDTNKRKRIPQNHPSIELVKKKKKVKRREKKTGTKNSKKGSLHKANSNLIGIKARSNLIGIKAQLSWVELRRLKSRQKIYEGQSKPGISGSFVKPIRALY
jgi:hypothetical protein